MARCGTSDGSGAAYQATFSKRVEAAAAVSAFEPKRFCTILPVRTGPNKLTLCFRCVLDVMVSRTPSSPPRQDEARRSKSRAGGNDRCCPCSWSHTGRAALWARGPETIDRGLQRLWHDLADTRPHVQGLPIPRRGFRRKCAAVWAMGRACGLHLLQVNH